MPEQAAEELARPTDERQTAEPRWLRTGFWASVVVSLAGLLLALVVDGAFGWLFYMGLGATVVNAGWLVHFRRTRSEVRR
jgi:hypothetical protein